METGADTQATRLGRDLARVERVLEQRLNAGDQKLGPGRSASVQGPRLGPLSRREPASLRSYAREERGSRTTTASGSPSHDCNSSATRSPISASRATQHSRSPVPVVPALAVSPVVQSRRQRKVLAPCGTAASDACRPLPGSGAPSDPSLWRSAANAPLPCSSGGRTCRSGSRRAFGAVPDRRPRLHGRLGPSRPGRKVRNTHLRVRCRSLPSLAPAGTGSVGSSPTTENSSASPPSSRAWWGRSSPSSPSGSASPLRAASIWRRRGRPPRMLTPLPRTASPCASRFGCGGCRRGRADRPPRRAVPIARRRRAEARKR